MFRNWRALLIYDKKCLHLQNSWVLLTCAAAAKSLQLCPTLCDPIRWQPTRLPRPWDSPGKNTGVGCHFLLQWMKVKSESEKWKWSLSAVSDSSRPPGLQPTRLLHPWDFPGKSTRVGCHCLLWTLELAEKNNLLFVEQYLYCPPI